MEEEYYNVDKSNVDEWNYMWKMLAESPINSSLTGEIGTENDPTVACNDEEVWQYMDTSLYAGELKHCFRHREHPATNRREYVQISVSKDFHKEK
jgi:hypothetical protein